MVLIQKEFILFFFHLGKLVQLICKQNLARVRKKRKNIKLASFFMNGILQCLMTN